MKLGCDPEIFLQDANSVRSAIGLIGGTKAYPRPIDELGEGFAVQEDNVAVEFNTPPADNADLWSMQIDKMIKYLEATVGDSYGLRLSNRASAQFSAADLENPLALEFGCDPDFNAWTGKINPKPKADDHTLRSAGGHVHIGDAFASRKERFTMVKLCDLFMGVGSVLLDTDVDRKRLYGKHGACRIKPYGVEYRTMSNFWIWEDKLRKWVFVAAERARDSIGKIDIDAEHDNIVEAIDNNNKKVAEALVQKYNIYMP